MDPTHFARALFEHLHREGVRICHWKSNQHLAAALAGRTDLDVLVHGDDRAALEAGFGHFAFTRVLSPWEGRYPGLEDWLGMDPESGGFLHMHVHYRLVLGAQNRKCYHLPLEQWVLEHLRQLEGAPVPRAEVELFLLVLRMHLKLGRGRMRRKAGRPGREHFPPAIAQEFDWLAAEASPELLLEGLALSGLGLAPERLLDFVEHFQSGELRSAEIRALRRDIVRALEARRWESRPAELLRGLAARLYKDRRWRKLFGARKKRLVGPGRVLALIGADGAGKTSLCRNLRERLSWKLRVESAYLGLPKSSPVVRSLRWLQRRLAAWHAPRAARLARELSWVWVAGYRLRTARRTQRQAARGALVILDRYPQAEFASMPEPMDGARIASESAGRAGRLGRWEEALYARIPPATDCFLLTASLECLRARKADLALEKQRSKVEAVNALARDAAPTRHVVDASRPLEEVQLEIAREFWRRILERGDGGLSRLQPGDAPAARPALEAERG